MGMTEIYTALQQGTVEAQENPVIMSYNFGFADVCKYLIKTDHVSSADMFVMDASYFNKQSVEIQQALTSAGNEAAAYISRFIKENEQDYLNKWREKGAEIVIPKTSEFVARLDGFIEKEFPHLTEYVTKIRAVK
jgi:TRAP-type C4-dicarboxylate transport system substrate-binding protein